MTDIRRITHITQPQMHDLCVLLEDCVDDGTSVGFLAPLTRDRAEAYWRSVQAALTDGPALFVAEDDGAVVGSVQLAPSPRENGRHRAEVQKLFVLRSHRGRGIGSRLMRAAEDHARSIGRMLLVLDTHQGRPAEAMYAHWGWQRCGVIPNYAATPDGTLHGTVLFCKWLGPAPE